MHLRYGLTDVLPQSNSLPEKVFKVGYVDYIHELE